MLRAARVLNDVGKASGELLDLLPKLDVRPASLQEKYGVPGSFPRFHFMSGLHGGSPFFLHPSELCKVSASRGLGDKMRGKRTDPN